MELNTCGSIADKCRDTFRVAQWQQPTNISLTEEFLYKSYPFSTKIYNARCSTSTTPYMEYQSGGPQGNCLIKYRENLACYLY
jgi:hypothetical protein